MEAALGAVAFVGLFAAWVILPSHLRKKHDVRAEGETKEIGLPGDNQAG